MELTNIKIKELKMFYSFKGKTFGFFEWMVHPLKESMSGGSTHESGRGGGTHGGCRTPLYILRGGAPLSTTHNLSPSSCCSTFRAPAWRSPAQIDSPPSSRRCAAGVFWWIFYFRCPTGTRDRRSSSSRTCDRVRK